MEESWGLKGQNKLYRLSWFNEINLDEIKEKISMRSFQSCIENSNLIMDFVFRSYRSWNEDDNDDGQVVHKIINAIPNHKDTPWIFLLLLCRECRDTAHNFLLY